MACTLCLRWNTNPAMFFIEAIRLHWLICTSVLYSMTTTIIIIIPYKMKIWRGVYFGGLANYKSTKLNTAKFSFYYPMHVKYNSVCHYKICQSLRNDWFAKLNCHQIFILYSIYRIMQFVRGGKVSWMDKILSIRWKSFAVRAPWWILTQIFSRA